MNNKRAFELLVIENNPADVDLMREALEAHGDGDFAVNLSVAEDGQEGLRFVTRHPPFINAPRPDLVFLDLDMPVKGGHEVLRVMKSTKELKEIPVVIFTTSNHPSDVEASYQLGANGYVNKPSDFSQFKAVLLVIKKYWFETLSLPPKPWRQGNPNERHQDPAH